MSELTFIKLGGSLITDKQRANSYHAEAVARVGAILHEVWVARPDLQFLIGHGSGSFGHVAAQRYDTINGVHTVADWVGFAHVAAAAAELNQRVTETLRAAGLPVWRLQPSASALSRDGELLSMAVEPVRTALHHRLIPLVYGDVSLDEVRGGTIISTETVFFHLALHLPVTQILLLGDVDGVWDRHRRIIPLITSARLPEVLPVLGGSAGTDVTGGMADKVQKMLRLVQARPGLSVRIMGGDPDQIRAVLLHEAGAGTLIRADG